MKKIFDNKLFIFFIGVILSSGITYAATLLADNVSYDNTDSGMNANNVQDAIDELYTKANQTIPDTYKDLSTPVTANSSDLLYGKTAYKQDGTIVTGTINTYNGTTSVTPTTSSQTIETGSKYVGSNITIGAIPSTYKNLTTTTTVASNKLLNGVTAYNSSGQLITGSVNTNCIDGTYTHSANTQVSINLGFNPSLVLGTYTISNIKRIVTYSKDVGNDFYLIQFDNSSEQTYNVSSLIVSGNTITSKNTTNNMYINSYTFKYMACR